MAGVKEDPRLESGREAMDWRRLGRLAAWVLAAGFFLATVVFALVAFGVTVPEVQDPGTRDLVDNVLADFRVQQEAWPQELASRLLFAAGFLALAGVGWAVRRLFGREDPRSAAVAGAFGVAGILGVAATLATTGFRQIAIDPHYCQCRYAPEQVLARWQAVMMAETAEEWVFYGAFLLGAIGFFLVGRLALAGGYPRGWGVLAYVGAGLFILALVASLFDQDLVADLTIAAGGGIVMPVWALWFARILRTPTTVPGG
jgi:hypothetical protein